MSKRQIMTTSNDFRDNEKRLRKHKLAEARKTKTRTI